jgi:PAS domain S-box-containing protein
MRLTLASRLALVTALLAVALVGASMVLFYTAARLALEANTRSRVQAAADDKAASLGLFFRGETVALEGMARDLNVVQALAAFLRQPSGANQAVLQEQLTSHTSAARAFGTEEVIDAQQGRVLASTDAGRVGADLSAQRFFINALAGSVVQVPTDGNEVPATIVLATPIVGPDGRTLGVLVGDLALDELQTLVGGSSLSGATGEIYLLSEGGYFLSQPRLSNASMVLTRQDTSQAASSCLTALASGDLVGPDYRGQVAIISYRWMPDYHICLIAKVDRAEAIAPLQPLVGRLLGVGVLVLFLAIVASIIFARMVSRPILALQRGVEAFGRGDLSQRIAVGSQDELGSLARSFNAMADSIVQKDQALQDSNRLLAEEAAERREALEASEGELQALFSAMHDVVMIFDRDGRYLHSAPTANRRLRALLRSAQGKTLHEVLPAELADRSLAQIRHALSGSVVTDFEYEWLVNDELMYFSANISSLGDDKVIWVVRDITGRYATRQALARSEAVNRAVVENSPIGISIRDRDLKLVYANEAWWQMLGFVEGSPAVEGAAEDYRATTEPLAYLGESREGVLRIFEHGGAIFVPEIKIPDGGQVRWVSQYFYGIVDGGRVDRVVILTQDITLRKEGEEEVGAILEFSAAMRQPISRAETQLAILDNAERLFATEAVGIALRHPSNPNIIVGDGRGAWQLWANLQQPATAGVLAHILRTGEWLETDDALSDPHVITSNMAGIPCVAAAPLSTRTQVLGALAIGSMTPLPRSKVRLLRAISEVAASAMNRAILFEETERRLRWLQAIRSIDRAIMGSMDVRITMNVVLEKAVTQLGMNAASVLLLRGNRLEYAFGRGFKTGLAAKTSLSLGQPQAGKVALENSPVFVSRYDPAEWQSELMAQEGFKSYCGVPLNSKGQVLGVIQVFGLQPLEMDPEWMDFLQSLAGLAALSLDTATLLDAVQRTNMELSMAYDVTLEGWSRSIDLRYDKVPGHTARVVDLTMQVGRAFGLEGDELVNLRRGALLHDVGTVMVPEEILLKPGKLTLEEAQILHAYPARSYEMLSTIDFLRPALDIPYCHHEKWDGSGFPRGLANIHIPFVARMFSVVEAWDSLTHDRPYRKAWPRKKALRYLEQQAGKHFDPEVVRVFLGLVG